MSAQNDQEFKTHCLNMGTTTVQQCWLHLWSTLLHSVSMFWCLLYCICVGISIQRLQIEARIVESERAPFMLEQKDQQGCTLCKIHPLLKYTVSTAEHCSHFIRLCFVTESAVKKWKEEGSLSWLVLVRIQETPIYFVISVIPIKSRWCVWFVSLSPLH